jgi:sigma-B regulation protein RsbU (phosphoserine phosphatase)
MIKLKSLQQRLVLFLLLPVTMLLVAMGFAGFIYARNSLFTQWREAAILKLQKAAHQVDMRLSRPKEFVQMYHETAGTIDADAIQEWIIAQLKEAEGVSRVTLTWLHEEPMNQVFHPHKMKRGQGTWRRRGMRRFHRAKIAGISFPRYDSIVEHETVSLVSDLFEDGGQVIGRLEVALRFDYLIGNTVGSDWRQGHKVFLVDDAGRVLTCNVHEGRQQLGDNKDPLELETLKAIKEEPFGTILGSGHPPDEVSGFFRLREAPWSLVVVAPGRDVLAPIVRFRSIYAMAGITFIFLILILIRVVTGRTVSSIREVSSAADGVAQGHYDVILPVKSQDEVGQLIQSFNTMVLQLEERMKLKEALDLAVEIQQKLLPKNNPKIKGLDIAGMSIYCDETGGDYYDYLDIYKGEPDKLSVVVGDVSGHGIPSALLMATARAFLRLRSSLPGGIASIVTDVNQQLTRDVEGSGQFMTLFFLTIDRANRSLRWVRAGHDPATLYDPATDTFTELFGSGVALGIVDDFEYEENEKMNLVEGQIIVISTDGIYEAHNSKGEIFGKEGIYDIIRQNPTASAREILKAIIDGLRHFQKGVDPEDDVTLVVIKVENLDISM